MRYTAPGSISSKALYNVSCSTYRKKKVFCLVLIHAFTQEYHQHELCSIILYNNHKIRLHSRYLVDVTQICLFVTWVIFPSRCGHRNAFFLLESHSRISDSRSCCVNENGRMGIRVAFFAYKDVPSRACRSQPDLCYLSGYAT